MKEGPSEDELLRAYEEALGGAYGEYLEFLTSSRLILAMLLSAWAAAFGWTILTLPPALVACVLFTFLGRRLVTLLR